MRRLKGCTRGSLSCSCLIVLVAAATSVHAIRMLRQASDYTARDGERCENSNVGTFDDDDCQERCDEDAECAAFVIFGTDKCKLYKACTLTGGDATDVAYLKQSDEESSSAASRSGGDDSYEELSSHFTCASVISTYSDTDCQQRCDTNAECEAYATTSSSCLTLRNCEATYSMFVKHGGSSPEGYERNSGKTCNASSMSTHTDDSCEEKCSDDEDCVAYVEFSDRCKLYESCPLEDADSDEDVAFVKSGESGSGETPEGYERNSGKTCNASSMSTHTDDSCEEKCSDDEDCVAYVEFSDRCKLYESCPLEDANSDEDVAFVKT